MLLISVSSTRTETRSRCTSFTDDAPEAPNIPTGPDVTEADLGESVETDDLYNSFTDADFDSDNASDDSDSDDEFVDF